MIPLAVLIVLLVFNISIFGSDSILGASQVALLVASGVCIALSMWLYKTPWEQFEGTIAKNVGSVASAILILFLIGAISGTWTMSGVVPAFIYYGLHLISPKVFLLTTCILCALVSVMTGSSWTTIATVGVALLGIGRAEGFSDAMTAGAIISGAYFGDKISPLSDTTVPKPGEALRSYPLYVSDYGAVVRYYAHCVYGSGAGAWQRVCGPDSGLYHYAGRAIPSFCLAHGSAGRYGGAYLATEAGTHGTG